MSAVPFLAHVNQEEVEQKPIAGPVYPSTLSLQSRKSQQQAERHLLPSAKTQQDELQNQLDSIDAIPSEKLGVILSLTSCCYSISTYDNPYRTCQPVRLEILGTLCA